SLPPATARSTASAGRPPAPDRHAQDTGGTLGTQAEPSARLAPRRGGSMPRATRSGLSHTVPFSVGMGLPKPGVWLSGVVASLRQDGPHAEQAPEPCRAEPRDGVVEPQSGNSELAWPV